MFIVVMAQDLFPPNGSTILDLRKILILVIKQNGKKLDQKHIIQMFIVVMAQDLFPPNG